MLIAEIVGRRRRAKQICRRPAYRGASISAAHIRRRAARTRPASRNAAPRSSPMLRWWGWRNLGAWSCSSRTQSCPRTIARPRRDGASENART